MYNAIVKNNRVVVIDDDGNEHDVCSAESQAVSPYNRPLTVTFAQAEALGLPLATNDEFVPYVNSYSGRMAELTA